MPQIHGAEETPDARFSKSQHPKANPHHGVGDRADEQTSQERAFNLPIDFVQDLHGDLFLRRCDDPTMRTSFRLYKSPEAKK
jgi:hypothetical protein